MKKLLMTAVMAGCLALPAWAAEDAEDMDKVRAMTDRMFTMIDADGNGMVSKGEHEDFAEKMFEEADANDDGDVTKQEMVEHKIAEKAKFRASETAPAQPETRQQ